MEISACPTKNTEGNNSLKILHLTFVITFFYIQCFRWQRIFSGECFPEHESPELRLNNLQSLEINANDLHLLPEAACKSVVKLDVNVTHVSVKCRLDFCH